MDPAFDKTQKIPEHIAIIMDGNGRWAKERGLPRTSGHKAGAKALKEVVRAAKKNGVKYLTLYAFSSENWNRPKDEVKALMALLCASLKSYKKNFVKEKIRFETIGDISALDEKCRKLIAQTKELTKDFSEHTLVLALNYGSRNELEFAVKNIVKDALSGKIAPDEITYQKISRYFYTKDIPDPDFIIRTSGESRLSNYLLMQAAYAELYFTNTYWPDFGEEEFDKALLEFAKRNRRYGKTQEQIK